MAKTIRQPLEGIRGIVCFGLGPLVGLAVQFDVSFIFGAIAFAVLLLTTVIVYMIRDLTDDEHLDLYAILIAAFWVSVAQLILSITSPDLSHRMGIYLPCLAASPLILSRVPALLMETESTGRQFRDVFVLGAGFWAMMTVSGLVRELFSAGTLTLPFVSNVEPVLLIPVLSLSPVAIVASGAGGLIILGLFLALKTAIDQGRAVRTVARELESQNVPGDKQ